MINEKHNEMILTHKLITTENYLLIVDDSEIKENDYVYVEGHVNPQICKGFENNGDVLCYNNLPYIKEKTKKVISQLPLNNSPILEGVDLLPPLEDKVEKLADEIVGDSIYYEEDRVNLSDGMDLFMLGYNKAKEKYKYTEEDLRKAIDMAQSQYWDVENRGFSTNTEGDWSFKYTEEEIIQSLQPKTEWEVEIVEGKLKRKN